MTATIARLIERSGDRAGRSHALGLGVHLLGRVGEADVVLGHADVSRRHAELEIDAEGARIRDLHSKNGLLVDGRRVSTSTLGDGAVLELGELVLELEHGGARVDRLLVNSGEVTVRRPLGHRALGAAPEDERTQTTATATAAAPSMLPPALAALGFAILAALLLFSQQCPNTP
ncbi:FHA domain-containing protein [Pseudenhygromyxa sp. WMMC2535]|uniref:FHA domain-containing protein n=1 Tax=Pseudenhygromyxa sp. WMMC2535 TaxID=2712867 RepID=UPI001554D881|nr:FHA domain-containing protein [Pseudenhygromyxa sp. WMMC2535]NVB39531.1 FHA domain-containing protein [Pseudenhygromyxa sp. WMMC2535]